MPPFWSDFKDKAFHPSLVCHFKCAQQVLTSEPSFVFHVTSDSQAEKKRGAQSSSRLHKQVLYHQYCRAIHTAGAED